MSAGGHRLAACRTPADHQLLTGSMRGRSLSSTAATSRPARRCLPSCARSACTLSSGRRRYGGPATPPRISDMSSTLRSIVLRPVVVLMTPDEIAYRSAMAATALVWRVAGRLGWADLPVMRLTSINSKQPTLASHLPLWLRSSSIGSSGRPTSFAPATSIAECGRVSLASSRYSTPPNRSRQERLRHPPPLRTSYDPAGHQDRPGVFVQDSSARRRRISPARRSFHTATPRGGLARR